MNKLIFVLISLVLTGCNVSPDGDQVAVLIQKPIIFGHGGIDEETVSTGLTFIAPTTSARYYKITPWSLKESFTDLNSSDNFPVDFDAYLNLKIDPLKASKMLKDFGSDDVLPSTIGPAWYVNNISPKVRDIVRDEMSKYTMIALSTRGKELDDAQITVEKRVKAYIAEKQIPVVLENLSFSKISPDQRVIDARAETAAQEQRLVTEQKKALAEVERAKAETERAKADSAYVEKMGLSPEQFTKLEQTKLCSLSSKCTLILGNGIPVINNGQ